MSMNNEVYGVLKVNCESINQSNTTISNAP